MKQYLIAVIGGAAILIASCKEKGPAIDFSDVTSVETTYVSAPADPQARREAILFSIKKSSKRNAGLLPA